MGAKVGILPGAFQGEVFTLFDDMGFSPTGVIDETLRALVFIGGSDIAPSIYGEDRLPQTEAPDHARDQFERKLFNAFKGKMLFIGICRGAQILNCFNGGALYQHVDAHEGSPHRVADHVFGEDFYVSSLHHQMMRPTRAAHLLLTANESTRKITGINPGSESKLLMPVVDDVEAVWYPNTNSFCIQSHPEIGTPKEVNFFFEFIDRVGM